MRRPALATMAHVWIALTSTLLLASCETLPPYDTILRHGTVYDGSGKPPIVADVAIQDDTIAAIGDLNHARGKQEIDVTGLAVGPGFINMLSWANESLIEDGKSQSDIRQGVTLEVMGEGESMGPWSDSLKAYEKSLQSDIKYDITWTTLGQYLDYLAKRGIATNVGSFVGATTIRENVIGFADRPPTPTELDSMRALARQAMHLSAEAIHVAAWPTVRDMYQVASRHYAFEGRCFVLACGQIIEAGAMPEGLDLPPGFEKGGRALVVNPYLVFSPLLTAN